MKAHVYVTLKKTVLDPQGQAIHNALRKMRYAGVADVRQGKHFELTLEDGMPESRGARGSGAHRPRGADESGDRGVFFPTGIGGQRHGITVCVALTAAILYNFRRLLVN